MRTVCARSQLEHGSLLSVMGGENIGKGVHVCETFMDNQLNFKLS